jgi:hypothetical protein
LVSIFLTSKSGNAFTKTEAETPAQHTKMNTGNIVSNTSGFVDPSADIEGILIINNVLYIDGIKIDEKLKKFHSKKSNTTYTIKHDSDGNLSATKD